MSKKIYINPGHSNNDPGAIGYEIERKLTVKVSNYMNEYLRNNYECETKMNPGTIDSLTTISNDANSWGADLVVSNHFNAGGGDGYEALIYNSNRNSLGKCFEKHVKAVGQNSRGVKIRPDLGILRLTNAPAVINEGAFVDNWTDIQDWNDDSELCTLGTAYAKAAAEYLSLPAKKNVSGGTLGNYQVKVITDALNIRKGPGTNYSKTGMITDRGVYTIVETRENWGRLKSGKGWICLDYVKKV